MDSLLLLCRVDAFLLRRSGMFMHVCVDVFAPVPIVTVSARPKACTRKIKYDVIGLNETRRHHPLHAAYDCGEELFLGTCGRGVGDVGVLLNTHLAMNIDSCLTFDCVRRVCPNIRLRRRRGRSYVELEKLYKEDRTFYKGMSFDLESCEHSSSSGSIDDKLPSTNNLIRGKEGQYAVGRKLAQGRFGAVYEVPYSISTTLS
ncbi:unnamed protein product [Heligmosomoides polygyrus]|uniref:Protein kinase domain-containing protein n=1 Tax=Heligmosomoides polygyrus TaxID=6339 RepID=A0A183FVL7_HELPZ|nr:unnamed protein product [Heligmosomoides polygyrus]